MSAIRLLDKQVAELIAAGEVVERPASVIKELVENSIDAGAKKITVEIKHGGISYMRVTDDGCGIARNDVHTAFLRHATSKVWTRDDLENIGTLGFRGEALASICAVSKVELLTKTKEEKFGTSYSISGGENEKIDDAGCPDGTTIVVRDLFYNTPARMKFLKKDVTEGIAVSGIIDKIALSKPDISFRYIRDGEDVFFTSGDGNLLSCIRSVCGREFAESMLEVNYKYENLSVSGYISKPAASRKNRSKQYFFINKRFVKSLTAMSALEEAYKNSIMTGKFPSCVLNIDMPYDFVDVNVHPSKTEVRFSNEKPVFYVVYYGAKTALENKDRLFENKSSKNTFQSVYSVNNSGDQLKINNFIRTDAHYSRDKFSENNVNLSNNPENIRFETLYPKSVREYSSENIFASSRVGYQTQKINIDVTVDDLNENTVEDRKISYSNKSSDDDEKSEIGAMSSNNKNDLNFSEFDYRVIGEVFNTYIICQVGSDVVFLDKHAAHERIIFNSLKKDGVSAHQMLLVPVIVNLSKEEYSEIISQTDLLNDSGFEVEDFGIGKVIVRAVPAYLQSADIVSSIEEIAGYLLENKRQIITEKLDWIYHSIACRAAVKGGNTTGKEDNENLVKTVFESKDVLYCPHGRPVIFKLSKREIERRFGRLQ